MDVTVPQARMRIGIVVDQDPDRIQGIKNDLVITKITSKDLITLIAVHQAALMTVTIVPVTAKSEASQSNFL